MTSEAIYAFLGIATLPLLRPATLLRISRARWFYAWRSLRTVPRTALAGRQMDRHSADAAHERQSIDLHAFTRRPFWSIFRTHRFSPDSPGRDLCRGDSASSVTGVQLAGIRPRVSPARHL